MFVYKNYDWFFIIDFNNEENDILGGFSNIGSIFVLFVWVYDDLWYKMWFLVEDFCRGKGSIFGVIMGGNYLSFEE